DGAKLLDIASEMFRQDFLPQANESGQRSRARIDDLKRGVERAAESVLGDDTEALRLAKQELDQLTDDLQREIARAEGDGAPTNQGPARTQAGDRDRADALASSGKPRAGGEQAKSDANQAENGSE